jgi:PAS domain S-box-containing protein
VEDHREIGAADRTAPVLRSPGLFWAAGVLVILLVITGAAWRATKSTVEAEARARFEFATSKVIDLIRGRVQDYSQILWGGAGLLAASPNVTREQWRAYVSALRIEDQLPGLQGIGFARHIPAPQKDAHVQAMRADGFPDYDIRPPGERSQYTSIVYLEPFDWRNQRAFGYDMFTEPVRRAAMERARDSARAAVSGKVTLVQETETDVQAGFLIYVPAYRPGAAVATPEQRRTALVGYVYSPFRMTDLMTRGALAGQAEARGLELEIYDGTAVQEEALLYRSTGFGAQPIGNASPLVATVTRSVDDRPWTFRLAAGPSFAASIDEQRPVIVLLAGIIISLLATAVTSALVTNRAQAIEANRRLSADVARRERVEEQLRQSESKFRLLFRDNPLPMWAYDKETLQIIEVNEATIAKYGYSRAEFEKMRITEFRTPDDVPRLLEFLASLGSSGRHTTEARHRLKDGQVIDVAIELHDAELSGRKLTLVAANDITERKRAREALVDSERLARGIVETALDAFIQMDDTGCVIEWNSQAQAMFGWSREEAIGKLLAALIVPERLRAAHAQGLERFLRTEKGTILGTRFEIAAVTRDGQEFTVEVAVTALRRRSGYVFNAFIRDLTEKRAAEAQLRQAQKMDAVGQLTGGIAHDFNNILTVITGTIEILTEGVEDRPPLAAIARMIDEAATRGAELTNQLLAFARRQPLQPRNTDINAMVVETAKLLRPTLGEQIEIESMLEDEAWRAIVDPSQLSLALLNLAVNARDAMPKGGRLTLETGNVILDDAYAQSNPEVKPGRYVMVAVSDTGIGIPAALRERVFEPFFTTKEVGKGTGLGLAMVYGFVKQSGGHIKVYSEEGHGTTIKLYLPRSEEKDEAQTVIDALPAADLPRGNETILVVEDDELVRNHVVALVGSLGYTTLSAGNGAAALKLIDAGTAFDLLFTDVIMPGGMNGRQLADETVKRRPAMKVLYTSGYTENAIVHQGRLDPGVALLNKPYRKAELARKLREVLGPAARAAS